MTDFLHGVEVTEIMSGTRPLETIRTGIIGLVGTAGKGPLNTPTLISGSRVDAVAKFGQGVGTIPAALDAIFDQGGAQVVVVNVLDPENDKVAVSEKDYTLEGDALVLDHRYVRKVVVKDSSGSSTYALNNDYTVDPETKILTRVSSGSIAADATLKVSYERPDTSGVSATDIIGAVNDKTGAYTGAQALLGAESVLGVQPKILIAPGYTSQVSRKTNTISGAETTEALRIIADRLRAVVVADGPNTTDAEAITYRKLFSSRRVYVVDPWVQIKDASGATATEGASARVAGVIARSDAERGFWFSPSNRIIGGIFGTSRPVDFTLGDASSRANVLNDDEVATIIRQNGYRLWGNRTCSSDSKWAFLSVVRIADAINESMLRAHLWAVDRNLTKTYLEDVAEGVNAYLRTLVGQGAILGGRCWPDPDLNTKTNIAAGRVYFNFNFTPPYPGERITFRSSLVSDYLDTLL